MKIAVLGATGVLARHLLPKLTINEHEIRALVRRPDAAGVAKACGAEIIQADIFDAASLRAGLEGCDIAINLATSLPGPSGRGDFAANDLLRRRGTEVFLEACRDAQVHKILQQSIAMLNASGGDEWSDEDTQYTSEEETLATSALSAALDMEAKVRASNLDFVILRGALFYGPGTGMEDDWIVRASAGKLRLPEDGAAFVSFVHIADMATAALATVTAWPSGETLIIADDHPARWRDVFGYLSTSVNGPEPQSGGRAGFPSFRLKNHRARKALAWRPAYSDYRAGMAR